MTFLTLTAVAFAEEAAPASPVSGLMGIAPLIILFVVFYFLLIRPQQKKMKDHKKMLTEIARGDSIITNGGLHGTITAVSDDEITVEIAPNVRVKVSKNAVAVKKKQG